MAVIRRKLGHANCRHIQLPRHKQALAFLYERSVDADICGYLGHFKFCVLRLSDRCAKGLAFFYILNSVR